MKNNNFKVKVFIMGKRSGTGENSIIKTVITLLLGFGAGFLLNHDWRQGTEAMCMGILLFLIYLLSKRIDDNM
ncbi:hypothetical protein AWU65_06345 [Paenibacillus glucanolyticus]|uniref:Uncharacterized protein n=1 Tax=Paenibacillus glucanolyticus TaxID=59843 RepID=A0A163HN91_9BACL|nr:hypothetical protein AWU65_06345 [Paenibacillus glucanolyticus]